MNGQLVNCVRYSSCNFIPILQKLYRYLDDALKICTWFGHNVLTPQFELSRFSGISAFSKKSGGT